MLAESLTTYGIWLILIATKRAIVKPWRPISERERSLGALRLKLSLAN